MSVATPLWFDASYYAEQKLDQLSLLKWDGKTGWTNSAYEAELAKYGVTPYENFVASNEVHNLKLTNLSPNPLFNVNEYLTALAQYANKTGYSYPGYKAGEWTAQKAMEHMFNDYHVSAWDHFTLAGQYNLINPSNAFDITAYYDQLTAWRNSYVDPETGVKGWEGRTDWTRLDVIEDNIWNQVNPIEGLFSEAAGSGIRPQPVAAKDQVTVDSDWNPWVASSGQTTPGTSNPIKPGKPVPGGSTGSGGDDGDDANDGWQPDETVKVGNDKGVYTGSDGEDTLFEAKDGLNPDSVIDGGEDSENVLNVNMTENFDGFNGVINGSATDPNLTNVQTVNLVNNSGESYTFSGKNTDGVENWNIENGPVNLSDLPDTSAAVGIKNVGSGAIEINYSEDALKGEDNTLTLNVNNVGTETSPVEGEPLNVKAPDKISSVTVNAAQNSENLVNLAGVAGAKDITVKGAGSVSLSDMGDNVKTVDASGLKGQFTATLDGENAPETIKGGSGSDDTVILGSGEYSGNWSGIENAVVDGAGNVTVNGADVTGLQKLVINHYTPKENSNITLQNIKAASFSVEESSSPESNSSANLRGEIGNFQYIATSPYDDTGEKTRDVVVEKTAVGTNFRTDASDTATITVADDVRLNGQFYLDKAATVNLGGEGQFAGLYLTADAATRINAEINNNSAVHITGVNGESNIRIKGVNNYVDISSQSASVMDNPASNSISMFVSDSGTINGGGGTDTFYVGSVANRTENSQIEEQTVRITVNGVNSPEQEIYYIYPNADTSTAITVNGFDETDRLSVVTGSLASIDSDMAKDEIQRTFDVSVSELKMIEGWKGNYLPGFYDETTETAYGFINSPDDSINTCIRLTEIDYNAAKIAFSSFDNEWRSTPLLPGKLEYSYATNVEGEPVKTTFEATVTSNPWLSGLAPGVKITGNDPDDRMQVYMNADFTGLGANGSMNDVSGLYLYNEIGEFSNTNTKLEFNAEKMSGVDQLLLRYGQFSVYNLEQPLHSLVLYNTRYPDSVMDIKFSDNAFTDYDGKLDIVVGSVGREESPLTVSMGAPVTELTISTCDVDTQWIDPDGIEGDWLDISSLDDIKTLTIKDITYSLDLTALGLQTSENVNITIEEWSNPYYSPGYLCGHLEFTETKSLTLTNSCIIGKTDESLLIDANQAEEAVLNVYGATNLALNAGDADVQINTDANSQPDFVNLKLYANSIACNGLINATSANIDLSNVGTQATPLDLCASNALEFKSAKNGSEVNADSQEAELVGSSGNDTFRVHVSNSATASGNGGNDTFVAYANKGTHEEGDGPVQVTFNGSTGDDGHDTFIVNTWQNEANPKTNAKLALTITGYDEGDYLRVTNVSGNADDSDGAYVNFAVVTKDDATSALSNIFGMNASELTNLVSVADGYSWLDSAKQCAYGFATDGSNNIIAAVKLDGVTDPDLAHDAFAPGTAQA